MNKPEEHADWMLTSPDAPWNLSDIDKAFVVGYMAMMHPGTYLEAVAKAKELSA